MTNEWLVHLEMRCVQYFFDLKKAFDSVPHSLLLQRLVELDVNHFVVQWVRSYLTNICQCVVVDGKQSSTLPVISGVPQGSVLGPLLFLIFINEVVFKVSPESSMSLFVDDMALNRPIYSPDDYAALQEDISKLVNWINSVLLALQPSKCCTMLISRKRDDSSPPPTFTVDGTNLALVKCNLSRCADNVRLVLVSSYLQPVCQNKKIDWASV